MRRSAAVRHAEGVREHPAPSGALRLGKPECSTMLGTSQGAPSTIRCIKTCPLRHPVEPVGQPVREHPAPSGALRPRPLRAGPLLSSHQGAPSTIRCIETGNSPGWRRSTARVREHPAPLGALRQPSGALRVQRDVHRQGAPSTIRCIKTWRCSRRRGCRSRTVREQPAPSSTLRLVAVVDAHLFGDLSGGTQHHQVH